MSIGYLSWLDGWLLCKALEIESNAFHKRLQAPFWSVLQQHRMVDNANEGSNTCDATRAGQCCGRQQAVASALGIGNLFLQQ